MQARTPILLAAVLLLHLPPAACASGGGGPEAEPPAQPRAAGQDGDEELTQAELEEQAREIGEEVEALRERKFEHAPDVEVSSRDDLLAYARERMDMGSSPERRATEELIAKLLATVPVDMDVTAMTMEVLDEQVGGFYDPGKKAFYVMPQFTGGLLRVILAHELTHALDDQLFDIDGRLEGLFDDGDAMWAYYAVVEGSGTTVMNRWTVEHVKDLGAELADADTIGLDVMARAPAFIWKPLLGAYMCGSAFLARSDDVMAAQMAAAFRDPEGADIDHAFEQPPRSSEQVLHPEKYWDPAQRDEPRALAIDGGDLPGDWEDVYRNTNGELMLAIVATEPSRQDVIDPANPMSVAAVRYTNRAASGWGGDEVVLFGSGDGHALVLATVWDSARDAGEFAQALDAVRGGMEQAAAELCDDPKRAGARVVDGPRDQVLLVVWSGVKERAVGKLLDTLVVREGESFWKLEREMTRR